MTIQTITWEDSNIEVNVVKEIINRGTTDLNLLFLATAGDTVIELLDQFPLLINQLICLSEQSRHLAVLELKLKLLINMTSPELRLAFLNGMLTEEKIRQIYQTKLEHKLISYQFWNHRLDMILTGIHLHDKWVRLFHSGHFNYPQLKKVLGSKVIRNSLNQPYSNHLTKVIEQHQSVDNLFSHLITYYQFQSDRSPNYLQADSDRLASCLRNQRVTLLHQNLVRYLSKTNRKFHLISLQTDQYSQLELIKLLNLIRHRMVPVNSRLILRRINSDWSLREIVNRHFIILDLDRDYLTDRTFLYQEIILATPRPI